MKQISLLQSWIDCRNQQPENGQRILAYTVIEEDGFIPSGTIVKKIDGQSIIGPTIRTYEKEYIEEGTHRPVAFWMPIDELTGMEQKA